MAVIDYYLSLNSPWSFLGSKRLMEIAARHGATVRVKPARFGAIFEKTGGLPLARRSPERRAYRMMELKRWRAFHGIPLVLEPRHFPIDEAPGTALVFAAVTQGLDALRLSHEIGRALWVDDLNTADAHVLATACARAGIDADSITQNAPNAAVLQQLWDGSTAEALSRGVFGAPSYVLESGEIFWGQDRLDFLDRALTA